MKKLPKRWKSVRRRWPAVKKSWLYDRLPVTAKQMDLVVKVLEAAIVVVLAVALLDKYLF